jgi:hypothetical protein
VQEVRNSSMQMCQMELPCCLQQASLKDDSVTGITLLLRIIAEFLCITCAIHCTFGLNVFTPMLLSPVVACGFVGKLAKMMLFCQMRSIFCP